MLNKERYFQVLKTLISFPSLPGSSNKLLADYIRSYLDEFSVPYFISGKNPDHLQNLYAIVGPIEDGGIILSGHMDIVGVSGQTWLHDPFDLRESDGKYYGRGTCDMKGFLALIMSLIPDLQEMNLKKPVCLAFTYDEETNCEGVQYLVKEFGKTLPKPDMAIVGEPSELGIIAAHKGDSHLTCEISGLAGHSSMPEKGVNTIYYAAKVITTLENIYFENKRLLKNDDRYDPPHSSLSVGTIKGGTSVNTIADFCSFDWETRTVEHKDLDSILTRLRSVINESLLPEMRKIHPGSDIKIIRHYTSPPLEYQPDSIILTRLSEYLGIDNPHHFVSFGTEAGYYQSADIPVLIWGPGSIQQAHKADEFIEISQLENYYRLLNNFLCQTFR